jgi:carbonic anhydrase/acetyltransferase-like protein (isoleucine patch superfamily)
MPIRPFENLHPKIAATAYIDPLALIIGDVTIDEYASVFPMVVARGDVQRIHIGARSNIQDGAILHVSHDSEYCPGGRELWIDNDVTVGHQAVLHACSIEAHCLVGIQAVVLDGARLEPYTLLAAGSLVPPNKTLAGGYLWRGSPVQQARPLTEQEQHFLAYSAQHYVKLAQRHKQQFSRSE